MILAVAVAWRPCWPTPRARGDRARGIRFDREALAEVPDLTRYELARITADAPATCPALGSQAR